VAGPDGYVVLVEAVLEECNAGGARGLARIERMLDPLVAGTELEALNVFACAGLSCMIAGLQGPNTVEELDLAARLVMLVQRFPKDELLEPLVVRLAESLEIPRAQQREAGSVWVRRTRGDDRYDALVHYARLAQRIMPSCVRPGDAARDMLWVDGVRALVAVKKDHEASLTAGTRWKDAVCKKLLKFLQLRGPGGRTHLASLVAAGRAATASAPGRFEERLRAVRAWSL